MSRSTHLVSVSLVSTSLTIVCVCSQSWLTNCARLASTGKREYRDFRVRSAVRNKGPEREGVEAAPLPDASRRRSEPTPSSNRSLGCQCHEYHLAAISSNRSLSWSKIGACCPGRNSEGNGACRRSPARSLQYHGQSANQESADNEYLSLNFWEIT